MRAGTPERAPQSVEASGVPLRQMGQGPLAEGGAVAHRRTQHDGRGSMALRDDSHRQGGIRRERRGKRQRDKQKRHGYDKRHKNPYAFAHPLRIGEAKRKVRQRTAAAWPIQIWTATRNIAVRLSLTSALCLVIDSSKAPGLPPHHIVNHNSSQKMLICSSALHRGTGPLQ
jgi:hypothetical protein